MNTSFLLLLVIYLVFVSLASCHVLSTEKRDICKSEGAEVYCASDIRTKECRRTEFCKIYWTIPVCERGPAAYCKTKNTAIECEKQDYCMTWPDDSVTAVKLPEYEAEVKRQKYWSKFTERLLKSTRKYMMRSIRRYGKYNHRRPGVG